MIVAGRVVYFSLDAMMVFFFITLLVALVKILLLSSVSQDWYHNCVNENKKVMTQEWCLSMDLDLVGRGSVWYPPPPQVVSFLISMERIADIFYSGFLNKEP